jgi:iron complex outermembrane recepter protein
MASGRQHRSGLTPIFLTVCVCATTPVWADTAATGAADAAATPAADTGGGLEEIVVTARKASEPLQTTPVAVTALSHADLLQQQVVQVADLQKASPDVAVGGAGTGPSSLVYLAIRGEGQNSPNSATDAAVGIYIDGVYLARAIIGNQGLLDVNQAEVLRGPQGTLFGRNTIGGALNITTNQPTDEFEGYVKGGYGNYDSKLGEAVLNLPLISGTLDSRLALRYDNHGAYYPNPLNSDYSAAKVNDDWQARGSLKWTPSGVPLSVLWTYDYAMETDTGTPAALTAVNTASNVAGPVPLGTLLALGGVPNLNAFLVNPNSQNNPNYKNVYFGVPTNEYNPDPSINVPYNFNRDEGFAQNLDLDVGATHLKSITAYRWSDTGDGESLVALPINVYGFDSEYIEHQFSEEVQLSGKAGAFDWIGGVYYFQEGGSERSDSQAFGFLSPIFGLPAMPVNRDYSTFEARSIAAFGQTNWHITDTLRFTVGYRYTWDQRAIDQMGRNDILGTNVCAVGPTAGTPYAAYPYECSQNYSANFSYPAWTAGFDWEVMPDTFVYLKTDKASMAGGFNVRPVPTTINPAFKPESNMDVEFGVKADTLDHHLRTNLALFAGWQDDVQNIVNAVVNSAGEERITQYVTNAGNTRTYGAELEVTALPWTGMEIRASGAYLHAAYVAGTFHEEQLLPDGDPVTVDRSGEPVPQAPKYTFSIGGTQTVPVAFGKLTAHIDYAWRDKLVYTWDTPSPLQPASVIAAYNYQNLLGTIPSYGLMSARMTLQLDHPDLEFALWGRNLLNTQYYVQQFDSYASLGTSENFQGDPRTYGGTVTYRFK